jgi:hypothetical protein
MTVPYTFANQTGAIPLSELDANFAAVPNVANVAGTVSTNAQPNITSVGTLTSLSVTGTTSTNLILNRAPIISLGANAGFSSNIDFIAIGNAAAGNNNQGSYAIAIGSEAGFNNQGANAVGIGGTSGVSNQGQEAVAIGYNSGRFSQGGNAVAVGRNAGNSIQGESSVAIGRNSGNINQGANAVSVGRNAGNISQGVEAVAIGHSAGNTTQGNSAVAIGWQAGYQDQKQYAVAIGAYAGNLDQGANSVAIGSFAGYPSVANNAIVINGDTVPLDAPNSGLYISPIRNNNSSNIVFYNTTTKEITYSTAYGNANVAAYLPTYSGNLTSLNTISAVGNVAGNYFIGNGSQLTGISAGNIIGSYSNANVAAYLPTYTGNVTANYFIGNGSLLTGISGGNSNYSNTNVSAYLQVLTSDVSTTGNVNGNNIYANAGISSTGNITTAGYFIGTFQGNVTGNFVVPGSNTQVLYNNNGNAGASTGLTFNSASNAMVVAGNVTAGNLIGNLSNGTSKISISSSGNVSVGIGPFSTTVLNINTSTGISVLGNVIASGAISVAGNVTANNFLGGGAGSPTVSATTNLLLSAGVSVQVTGGGTFRLPALTTADIANLIPVNGDMIYNSSLNKFQGYENGAWGNLI